MMKQFISSYILLYVLVLLGSVQITSAQNKIQDSSNPKIGTYFSIVHPILTFSENNTTYNFDDGYTVGFPTGVNFVQSEKIAFSMEFVPVISSSNNTSGVSGLLFHPGVIYRNIGGFNFLSRIAFNTNGRYGFTGVINKPIIKDNNVTYFLAMPFPVRFGNNQPASLTVGFQFGIGF